MEERLQKQLAFCLEIDKVKTFFAKRIYRTTGGMKTTRNIPGTWR